MRAFFFAAALLFCSSALAGEPDTYNYRKATEAIEQDDYDKAIELLEKEAKANPKNGWVYSLLGYAHFFKDDYDKALPLYAKALSLFGKGDTDGKVQCLIYRALTFADMEKSESMVKDLDAALKLNPDRERKGAIANIFLQLDLYDKSAEVYKEMAAQDPSDPNYPFALGNAYYLMQRFPDAISQYNRALELDESVKYAVSIRALSHLGAGNAQNAVDDCILALDRGSELEPKANDVLSTLLDTTLTRDPLIAAMRPKADADTSGMWAYWLAQAYEKYASSPKEALHYYRLMYSRDSTASSVEPIATFLSSEGADGEAVKFTLRGIKKAERDEKDYVPLLYYKLSSYQYYDEDLDGAIESARISKEMEYYEPTWLAYLLFVKGDYDSALGEYKSALKGHDDVEEEDVFAPIDFFYRSYLYKLKGENELAEAGFRKVIELEEEEPTRATLLSQHFLGLDDRAKENAAKMLENAKDDNAIFVDVAMLYALLGDQTMASQRVIQALDAGYINYAILRYSPFLRDVVALPKVQQAITSAKERTAEKVKELLKN